MIGSENASVRTTTWTGHRKSMDSMTVVLYACSVVMKLTGPEVSVAEKRRGRMRERMDVERKASRCVLRLMSWGELYRNYEC